MSAINRQTKNSSKNSLLIVGIITLVAGILFVYLMWHVEPQENEEIVKVIAITEDGCIGETMDGFAVNIGTCHALPGEYVLVPVDQKTKERAAAMNPTS